MNPNHHFGKPALLGILLLILVCTFFMSCSPSDSSDDDTDPEPDDDDDNTSDDDDDDDDDSCLDPDADCTLAETAAEAGFFAGAAVPADDGDPRMAVVPLHFNSMTAENAMKWGELCRKLGQCDFSRADALMAYAEANGLRVRGHCLVWGKYPGHGYPGDLEELIEQAPDPYAFVDQAISEHAAAVVGRYAGRIESWDVVNEPLSAVGPGFENNHFYKAMGTDYIAAAFIAAHDADPGARLFLNEILMDYDGPKAESLLALLQDLIGQGVPIDGVGIQGHLYLTEPEPALFESFLQDIAGMGLDVELTELDMAKNVLWDDMQEGQELFDAQADAYDIMVSACLNVPSCTGITTWGIDDSSTWLDHLFPFDILAPNEPLLLDYGLEPKPAYYVIRERLVEAFGVRTEGAWRALHHRAGHRQALSDGADRRGPQLRG